MGFDHRSHRRISLNSAVRFWPYGENFGTGTTGEAINLSESGLAFNSTKPAPKGSLLQVEFRIPNRTEELRLLSEVVHCEMGEQRGWQVRVHFLELYREEFVGMRRYILQTADPKLASATGWGKALVPGKPSVVAQYRDLSPDQFRGWTSDRSFLAKNDLPPMDHFRDHLQNAMGNATPEKLRLRGSRRLHEKSKIWLELALVNGSLRMLCETIWSKQEPQEDPEAGLQVLAYNHEDAVRLDGEI
ncbi:MAG TPA: PilZ domain-containing protein [bacterium]|jgi:hypothetical protein|nr:PilZ domain-containing protein [bacterium]